MLTSFTAHRYRSFKSAGRLELRPLTLLLGQNNAGKSSLLRMLPLLERSVSEQALAPLDFYGPATRDASFTDSVWERGRRLEVELEWFWRGSSWSDHFTLRYDDLARRSYVERLHIEREGASVFDAQSLPHPEIGKYLIEDADSTIQLEFTGLLPPADAEHEALKALRLRLRTLWNKVQWLSSTRQPPARTIRASEARHHKLEHDGSDAAEVLALDDQLLGEVARWYAGPEIRRTLRTEPTGKDFRLLLDKIGKESLRIDLADTGDGMSQVLPVLVALALAKRAGEDAILAIEDPEAHLHENARRALAEHICEVASSAEPPRIVLETHSRTFLLGVQLAIARGELSRDDVIAYWIDQEDDGRSIAHPIHFSRDGVPESTILASVLAEDREMARQLLRLQMDSP